MGAFSENTAARYVPGDRLCLSPRCGFAPAGESNILTVEQQWEKLVLIREITRKAWR